MPLPDRSGEGAAARQLAIVPVGGNGEQVDSVFTQGVGRHGRKSTAASRGLPSLVTQCRDGVEA